MAGQPKWIDRSNAKRTVPMQVLDFGFSRTGTSSMQKALEILGYTHANHGAHIHFGSPQDIDMWLAAVNAKFFGVGKPYTREDWDRLLGHCQAVMDAPHYLFAKELMEAYPDAKVILTTRDPDSWWKSMSATVAVMYNSPLRRIHGWLDLGYAGKRNELMRAMSRALWGTEDWVQEELCKARFTAHYEEVRKLTPKDKLLEMEVKEGWAPLCKFLGKEIPDVPFPKVNETKQFQEGMRQMDIGIMKLIGVKVVTPAVVLIVSFLAVYLGGMKK
ncbi:P-loop containing nucleoside triphosphate hydrolase protein [Mycena capillaripes]|nr:P-loop containing nucleoside triphosphate hydrolase protein [Mycena capillaripes]